MGNFAQTSLQWGDHKQRERRERLVAAASTAGQQSSLPRGPSDLVKLIKVGCDETSVKQSDEAVSEWSMVKAKRCAGSSCRSKEYCFHKFSF